MRPVRPDDFLRFQFYFLLKVTSTLPISNRNLRFALSHLKSRGLDFTILISVKARAQERLGIPGEERVAGSAFESGERGVRDLAPRTGRRLAVDGYHQKWGARSPRSSQPPSLERMLPDALRGRGLPVCQRHSEPHGWSRSKWTVISPRAGSTETPVLLLVPQCLVNSGASLRLSTT